MCTKEPGCSETRGVLWRETWPGLHCLPAERFSKQCSSCYLLRFSVQNGEKSAVAENKIMQPLVPQHKGRHLETDHPSGQSQSGYEPLSVVQRNLTGHIHTHFSKIFLGSQCIYY